LVRINPETGEHRVVHEGPFFCASLCSEKQRAVVWTEQSLRLLSYDSDAPPIDLLYDAPTTFTLSPCGKRLALGGDSLNLLDLTSGDQRRLAHLEEVNTVSWSPDGETLAFLREDFELWTVSTKPGFAAKMLIGFRGPLATGLERQGSYALAPTWSTDGRFFFAQLTWNSPRAESFRIGHLAVLLDLETKRVALTEAYWTDAVFQITRSKIPIEIPDNDEPPEPRVWDYREVQVRPN